jgi:hypothetical protein
MSVLVPDRAALALVCACIAGPAQPQAVPPADPLALIEEVAALCQAAPDSTGCILGRDRVTALVVALAAEAGRTLDRGGYIDPIRQLLTDPAPEIRAAAAFALSRLAPDATDTPAIRALLADPVSHVRAGGWAAAVRSSDPGLGLIKRRVPTLPVGWSWAADVQGYVPGALGLALAPGAEFLWLTADLRNRGELQFLTDRPLAEVTGWFAPLAPGGAVPLTALLSADPASAALGLGFLDLLIYGDPQAMVLPANRDRPSVLVVAYRDLAFGRTGFALVYGGPVTLFPPPQAAAAQVLPEAPPPLAEGEVIDDPPVTASRVKPEAPVEETDLFLTILAAHGYGAEAYLDLYPDGAYAPEARAILASPRLLAEASYPDTGRIELGFANVPPDAYGAVALLARQDGEWVEVDSTYVDTAATEPAVFDLRGRRAPGLYTAVATLRWGDGEDQLTLLRDFSIVAAPVTLALDRTEVAPGAELLVRFAGMSGGSRDYVATAPAGSGPERYITYRYTDGARDGTVGLTAPVDPGAYELRAFFNDDQTAIRASLPFTVTGSAPAGTPQPETPQPDTPQPQPPGIATPEPEVTLTPPASTGTATLLLDSTTVLPGSAVRFAWSGMTGATQDFITTARVGSGPESYLAYLYTNGAAAGSGTLKAPFKEGDYELRAIFASDAGTVQAMLPFSVRTEVRLSLPKTVFAPGESMTVTYSGMAGESQDYVATAPVGSAPDAYLRYVYTQGAREGSLSLAAPTEPGEYELRAILQSGEGQIKASLPFTVSASP